MKTIQLHKLWLKRISVGLLLASTHIWAATPEPAALTGEVSSAEEGRMEGVVVSAKRANSTITISVVSDAKGQYRFPRSKIGPGEYAVNIRATGYDPEQPLAASVKDGAPAQLNIRLKKTDDLSLQLTNAEWIASVPGEARDKRTMLNCVTCHTLQRVVHSKYSADDFIKIVLPRMQGYVNQSMPGAPQLRKGERLMEERGDQRVQIYKELGTFLASINLHDRTTWTYPLKTFPRPTGAATRVIYTEYDLPRKLAQPHDVILDNQGKIWYSSFGEQLIGRVDPVTGAVKEYQVAISKPDFPTGILALRNDREGKLWFGNMYQASISRFDPATESMQFFTPAKEDNLPSTQLNMVAPMNSGVDGKVWSQNNGFAGVHRFDIATGKVETWAPFKDSKEPHNIYDVISDSKNNGFFTDFRQEQIGKIDAKTGKVTLYEIPTKGAAPRRGSMDDQDRLWFGEYRGHKIGMLDTRAETFKEWEVPTPYSAPYDVVLDKTGHAWTGSMTTDRIANLDVKSGKFVEYLLPRSTNIRRVFVDNTSARPALWVGNNHGASIIKLETLE
jgi:virginiamycin B lyase